jgi:ATP-binding cassette subfamily B protein
MSNFSEAADVLKFPHHFLQDARPKGRDGVFFQQQLNDCGCAALKMVLDRFGIRADYDRLCASLPAGAEKTTLLGIKRLAEAMGLCCEGWRLTLRSLGQIPLPAILLFQRKHYAVVENFHFPQFLTVLDPVLGRIEIPARSLRSIWQGEVLLFCRRADARDGNGWFKDP